MTGTMIKAAVALLGGLIVADIAGVIACTLFDVLPIRGRGAALPYAIWPVFGIFCGLLSYNTAGAWATPKDGNKDWTASPDAGRTGMVVLATGAVLIAVLRVFFYTIYWSQNVAGEYYVPDSMPHSIVFFGSVLFAMGLARFKLMPTP